MKIKRFNDINEGLRDKMKPKPEGEILDSLMKLTPRGMLDKIIASELDDNLNYISMAEERIIMSENELDKIFKETKDEKLNELIDNVAKWVDKNGGNPVNVTDYGLTEFASHLVNSEKTRGTHDYRPLYDSVVFESFRKLLAEVAMCEVKYNNRDYEY